MGKKSIIVGVLLTIVLIVLLVRQAQSVARFDWHVFLRETAGARPLSILFGLSLIYLAYGLRAWRWKIFMQPVCPTSLRRLLGPTIIGFTGLGLLGRPGELIRPYLIARRHNQSVASQMAVWTVERIFDLGAFAVLLAITVLSARDLASLPYYGQVRRGAVFLILLVLGASAVAFGIRRQAGKVAAALERITAPLSPTIAHQVKLKTLAFGEGLNTIAGLGSFASVSLLSLLMWSVIAGAYLAIIHAYPPPLADMSISRVLLLMAFAMLGSMVQLPGGGGSQLVVIAALLHVFHVRSELAVSCGILLWLAAFMAPVPVGLLLLRQERLTLQGLSRESRSQGEAPPEPLPAPGNSSSC